MRTSFDAMLEAVKGRKWRVEPNGEIRCGVETCPLVAAALDLNEYEFRKEGGRAGDDTWEEAARVIGYAGEAEHVTVAADEPLRCLDYQYSRRPRTLRRKMLDAFGLTEPSDG